MSIKYIILVYFFNYFVLIKVYMYKQNYEYNFKNIHFYYYINELVLSDSYIYYL